MNLCNFDLCFLLVVRHNNLSYIKGPFVFTFFELLVRVLCPSLHGVLGLSMSRIS